MNEHSRRAEPAGQQPENKPRRMDDRRRKRSKQRDQGSGFREWVITLLAAIGLTFLLRTYIAEPVQVDGPSMQPTLHTGQMVLLDKLRYRFSDPQVGDVVVCSFPNSPDKFIKRIVGLPGDYLEIRDGKLIRNGEAIEEKYIAEPMLSYMNGYIPTPIPDGTYFVMGDNRNVSHDSRDPAVGSLDGERILGRASAVIWPLGEVVWLSHGTSNAGTK